MGLLGAGGDVLHGVLVVHDAVQGPAAARALPGSQPTVWGHAGWTCGSGQGDGLCVAAAALSHLLRQQAWAMAASSSAHPCKTIR